MSKAISKEACPKCRESGRDRHGDNLVCYDDGHKYCYACQYAEFPTQPREEESMNQDYTYEYIPARGLTAETLRQYHVMTGVDPDGRPHHHKFPYPKANKFRLLDDKKFWGEGESSAAQLFGQQLFNAASARSITITEGEYDAMSVYQMLGSNYPVVSVRSSGSAHRDCAENYKYLDSFERIYLCFDNDPAGQKAKAEVASLFDFNKVFDVKLTSFKDANEYLTSGQERSFKNVWYNSQRFLPVGITSGIGNFVELLKVKKKEAIATYPFRHLQEKTFGIRSAEAVLLKALEGVGKQLPVTTRVPTPSGWTTMGNLKVGDTIFGRSGKPTTVTYVTPVQYDIPCYKVVFNDGTSQVAGGPHKWGVFNCVNRYSVKTTEEMYNEGVLIPLPNGYDKARYSVPICDPVDLPDTDLPIDPYLLGYWLGDGHSYSADITVGWQDIAAFSANNNVTFCREDKTAYTVRVEGLTHKMLVQNSLLKNKHIPPAYLRSSIAQRMELLRGLMDSDGSWSANGVEFYSSSKTLVEDVKELVQSLGYAPRIRTKQGKVYGVPKKMAYTLWFLVRSGEEVFKYERKAARAKGCATTRMVKKAIRDIIPVPSVPSVCIQVDSPDHLYLVDNFLVTHNTELLRAIEYHILKTTDYNVGILHFEEDDTRVVQGMVNYELKTPVHLPNSTVSHEEEEKAIRSLVKRDDRVHVYSHFDSDDPDTILNTIRFLVAACGCKFIFLDHITWLVTGMEEGDERKKLDYLSTKLAQMVKDLDFALIFISHVNDDGKTRGSRNISKVANLVVYLSRDLTAETEEERTLTTLIVEKNRFCGDTGPAGVLKFDRETFTIGDKPDDTPF